MIKQNLFFRYAILVAVVLCLTTKHVSAQLYAIKTNIPALVVTNLNVAFEMSLSKKVSIEFPIYANPWRYNDRYSAFYGVAQPGVRYWMYECFTGPFVGAQTGFGIGQLQVKGTTYRGYFGNVGASFGYAWMLGMRWNLEAELGAGYYWLNYKTRAYKGTRWTERTSRGIFGPTRAGLNLVYLF